MALQLLILKIIPQAASMAIQNTGRQPQDHTTLRMHLVRRFSTTKGGQKLSHRTRRNHSRFHGVLINSSNH